MRPAVSETRHGFPSLGVQSIEIALHRSENSLFGAVRPVGDATIRPSPRDARIEAPQQLSSGGIEGDGFMPGREAVEDAVNDDGLGLRRVCAVGGVVGPGDLQTRDIGAVNLLEVRIASLPRPAIERPVL